MNNENEKITYYDDWLSLDKKEFRVLSMIADVGEFSGNITDMCKYLNIDATQDKHHKALKKSIEILTNDGYILSNKSGNTYTMSIAPKENEIKIYRKWVHQIMNRKKTDTSVAWEQVLKLYLFYYSTESDQIVTNIEIASHLNVSESTVSSAKKVLSQEFEAIIPKNVQKKLGKDFYTRIGHQVRLTAWWNK